MEIKLVFSVFGDESEEVMEILRDAGKDAWLKIHKIKPDIAMEMSVGKDKD